MATTTNGIYYPSNYDSVADIPEDMKKMAESIDEKIITDVTNIKTEQQTQNTNITNLQTDTTTTKQDITNIKSEQTAQNKYIQELEAENERLKEDLNGLPTGQASGESIDLVDSAKMRLQSFKISGNSKQNGEPTPDTPVDIECCGDNINLLVTENSTNCTIGPDGQPISDSSRLCTDFIPINFEHNKLILSANIILGFVCIAFFDENKQFISRVFSNTVNKISAERPSNAIYLKVSFQVRAEVDVNINSWYDYEIKLEKGLNVTKYTQPGQGCINEVICNKNLFNEKQCIANASISSDGVITSWNDMNLYYFPVQFGKSYAFHYVANGSPSGNVVYGFGEKIPEVGVNGYTYNYKSAVDINNSIFTPTNENQKYLCMRLGKENKPYMKEIQFEEGNRTEYQEHKTQTFSIPTQQPFRSVGDTRDTFIKKDGKRFERHKVGRYYFTGNESGWLSFVQNGVINIYNNSLLKFGGLDSLCNIIKTINNTTSYIENTFVVFGTLKGFGFFFKEGDFTLNTFKTYLQEQYNAGTPVYVDYILETPVDIECTEEQSRVLDEIDKTVKSYKGVTHFYSTDNVSPIKTIVYRKDLEQLQTQLDEIKALLSTTQTSAMLVNNLENDLMEEV